MVKYYRGAVKIHTLLDLRGSIPSYILITDGKCHGSNVLNILTPLPNAIYIMDKAYIDFKALYHLHELEAFFIYRAKTTMDYSVIENNFNIDESTGFKSDKISELKGYKYKKALFRTIKVS